MPSPLPLLLALAACTGATPGDTSDTSPVDDTSPPLSDADADGFEAPEDCNDQDASVYPGAPELCDGQDNDCDGRLAPGEHDDGDGLPDCTACDDAGYWELTREVTSSSTLRQVLLGELTDLVCGYSESAQEMFLRIDNRGGKVECVYTGRETTVVNQRPDPNNDMNTEHTWPQSEGADTPPAKCDLHHLYPTDVEANSKRSNHPFGEVTGGVSWSEGGSRLGTNSGDTVFEPRDAHKGNVARSMFYFALRYGHSLSSREVETFKRWHLEDPPDAEEVARSHAIAAYQAYDNPFVTCPELVEIAY